MSIQNPVVVAGITADAVPLVVGLPLIAGGSAVSVSGSFSATNPSITTTGSNVPGSATYIGGVGADGKLHGLLTDNSGQLNVNIVSGGAGGIQFADNAASGVTPTGTLEMGWDSANSKIRAIKVDTSQNLLVSWANAQHVVIDSATLGTVTVSGTSTVSQATAASLNATVVFPSAQHVIVDSATLGTVTVSGTVALGAGSSVIGHVVTDATSVTAATLSAETTKVIGTVNVAASQTIAVTQGTAANLNATVVFPAAQHVIIDSASLGTVTVSLASTTVTNTVAENLSQVGGAAFALGQQLAASSLPVVLTSTQLTTLTPLSTVTVSQGTANATPWNENVAQFGGSNVVTGIGVGGAGIPRVTISSDSFPASQIVAQGGSPWSVTTPDVGQDRTVRQVLEDTSAIMRELTDFMYTLRDSFQFVQTPIQGTVQVGNFPPSVNSVAVTNLPAIQATSVPDGLQDRVVRNVLEEILVTLQDMRASAVSMQPGLSLAISSLEGIS